MADSEAEVVSIEKGRRDEFLEFGANGLQQSAGYVNERESVPDLNSPERARKIYREMADNDPTIGGILFAVDMTMRQVEWTVNPADVEQIQKYLVRKATEDAAMANVTPIRPDDPALQQPQIPVRRPPTPAEQEAQRVADFFLTCLEDMSQSWEDTLSQIMSMLVYGWSYHETVYKRRMGMDVPQGEPMSKFDDGMIGWRKIAPRAQETLDRWVFDEDGGIKGMVQAAPPTYRPVFIPIEKSLLFRTSAQKNNPEGRSVLRNAYRPWYMKKRVEEIEGIGIERDLAGLPVMYVPAKLMHAQATDEQKQALEMFKKLIKSVKRDENEGIILPMMVDEKGNKLVELTLLSTGGRRQFDTDAIVARYDQRIAMTILADFILLGHEKVGSYSLGASKIDLFSMALSAWLDAIADTFNSYAIPRLMRLNGLPMELAPSLGHSKIESIDLDALGKYVTSLSTAGALTVLDEETQNHLRRAAGMPEIDASAEMG